MRRMLLCWLVIATIINSTNAKRYMKMFAEAGIGIHCPSGNKVYIHPISGDLQLCKQQLGVYNETSCPGGTACERFPILIPGFQDYCCWSENNPESESSSELELVRPTMSKRKPTVTVEPIDEENEKIFPVDEEEEDIKIEEKKSTRKKESEEEEGEEDIEWEFETTTVKPRKSKSRKVPVSSTTEPPILITTTTKSPTPRRPQCNDPEKTVLIDYGNRLRDCYFTQCLRGFKCEFNREIRRFICCGNEIDVPPAGLPPIPEPSPVLKRRPFRPNRPFGNLNDGYEGDSMIDEENSGPRNPIAPFTQVGPFPIGAPKVEAIIRNDTSSTAIPNPSRKGKYDEDEDYVDGNDNDGCQGNGCTFGRRRGGGGCEMNCRKNENNGNRDRCEMNCRRGSNGNGNRDRNSEECGNAGCPWNGNNNNGRPRRPRPETDYEDNENGCESDLSENNSRGGPVPPIPEPKPLCKGLKFKRVGNGAGNGNGNGNNKNSNNNNNNSNNSNRGNGPSPRNNGSGNGGRPMKPPPSSSRTGSNRRNGPPPSRPGNGSGGEGKGGNDNGTNHRNGGSGGNGRRNNNSNNFNGNGNGNGNGHYGNKDNCDIQNRCGGQEEYENRNENQRLSSRKKSTPNTSSNNNNNDRKVPRSVTYFPSQFAYQHSQFTAHNCPAGAEYLDGFTAPQCLPPAIDSCPLTHKKCRFSSRFGHHVCCKSQ